MKREPKAEGWSVVVTSLPEYHPASANTILREAFGATDGLPALYLLVQFHKDEVNLPAELRDGLTQQEAERAAHFLSEMGVSATARRSAEVGEVGCRAVELVPERAVNGFGFSEWNGMVLFGCPYGVRRAWGKLEENRQPWHFERGHNHVHQEMGAFDRVLLSQERQYVTELTDALRTAYPGRPFIVSHITLYAVSFYQPAPDAPEPGVTLLQLPDLRSETRFCVNCQEQATTRLLPDSDSVVPELRWVRCETCGNDILLGEAEIRTAV